MKKYVDRTIREYINELSAKTPTPGGGSVAALLGALGCGLISMVANFTILRDGFNGYKERARQTIKESERLRRFFMDLIDEDIDAYGRLSRALKRYKTTPARLQSSIKKAVLPPSKTCRYIYKAAVLCTGLAYIGNKPLLPDVCCAIYALDAAFESALLNIEVNLRLIGDKEYIVKKMQQLTNMHRGIKRIKTEVLSKAKERIE